MDVTEILHAAGLRRTPVRAGVVALLTKSKRPLTVQAIVDQLPDGTDVVTVYRTLNTLVKKRLARKVRGEDRNWLFESSAQQGASHGSHAHAHFVCDECGTVECLPEMELPDVTRKSVLGKGYSVSKQEVTLHGTCPKCG
jgi:Fur family transcriptional regulator, ferric uptake regulator